MKVYHPITGEVYEGEPVDCRELVQVAGYVKDPLSKTSAPGGYPLNPDGSPGTGYPLAPAPDQVSPSSAAKSAEVAGKAADQTLGRSAKVGK